MKFKHEAQKVANTNPFNFITGMGNEHAAKPALQQRLLHWMFLLTTFITTSAIGYLIFSASYTYRQIPQFTIQLMIVLIIATISAIAGFILNRIGQYYPAAFILVAIFAIGNWAAIHIVSQVPVITPETVRLVTSFLILSVLASSIFLSIRDTVLIEILHIVGFFIHDIGSGNILDTINSLIFLTITATFITCISFVRSRNEQLILQQRDQLSEREMLFQAVLNNSTALIYLKDSNGYYLAVNQKYATLAALPANEFIGKTSQSILPTPLAQAENTYDTSVLISQKPNETDQIIPQQGEDRTYLALRFPLYNSDGNLYGIGNIATDITEQQRTKHALEEVNSQLSAGLASLEQRKHEMELLKDLAETLQLCKSVEEAYRVITAFAARLFPTAAGAINLISQSRNMVERMALWGDPQQLGQAIFTPEQCWAIRRARAIHHSDMLGLNCEHLQHTNAPGVCVPMLSKGEVIGVIHAVFRDRLTNEQQQLISMFADTVALAITNLRLYEKLHFQSIRDGLTGLYNRRFLEESLDYELRRAARMNKPLCVVMLDMDHFKRFNDTFGHAAGDILLKEFGQLLIGHSRQSDILCRYGGEEFALILPETNASEALDYANRLRQQVKQLNIIHNDQALGMVTISIGIAAFPANGQLPQSLIEAADKALYTAKHGGRDQAIVAEPGITKES